jgi:hypothetical protein
MIDTADGKIASWVRSVVGDVVVSLGPPGTGGPGPGVSLYLLEVLDHLGGRMDVADPPVQVDLRYLVTTWAEEPSEAHRLLGTLLAAARLDATEFETVLERLPPDAWMAMGTRPQPSFVLRVPVSQPRPALPTRLVLAPLEVRTGEMVPLTGFVRGPDDVPLVGAQVRVAGQNLHARTDARGAFRFPAVGTHPPPDALVVRVKGRDRVVAVPGDFATTPVTIRYESPEG